MRSKFSICRRGNHALRVTLGRYSIPGCVVKGGGGVVGEAITKKRKLKQTFIEDVNCAMKLRQCNSNIMPLMS